MSVEIIQFFVYVSRLARRFESLIQNHINIFFIAPIQAGLGAECALSVYLFLSNSHATKPASFLVPLYSVTPDPICFGFSVIFYVWLPVRIVRHLFLSLYTAASGRRQNAHFAFFKVCFLFPAFIVGIIIVGFVSKEWLIAINAGITVFVLLLWSITTVTLGYNKEKE